MFVSPEQPTALPLSYRGSGRESNPRPVGPKLTEALRPVAAAIQLMLAGVVCDAGSLAPPVTVRRGQGSNLPGQPITDSLRPACAMQCRALHRNLATIFPSAGTNHGHGADRPLVPQLAALPRRA